MDADLTAPLNLAAEALDACGLRFALVGGLAIAAWGVVRATRDVDLHAELPPRRRADLLRELRARGFDVPAMDAELGRFGVFRSRAPSGQFVDLFEAVGPLGERLLDRRVAMDLGGRRLFVASPEGQAALDSGD